MAACLIHRYRGLAVLVRSYRSRAVIDFKAAGLPIRRPGFVVLAF